MLFALMIFLIIEVKTQTRTSSTEIEWISEEKEIKNHFIDDIAGCFDQSVIVFEKGLGFKDYNLIKLNSYNISNGQKKSSDLNLKEDKITKDFESFYQIKDKLYLFTTKANTKLRKNYLYVQQIDTETLLPISESKQIAEIDFYKYDPGSYVLNSSVDDSKLLVFCNVPNKENEYVEIVFHVFDSDLNQLWEKSTTLPYTIELFDTEDFIIDNQGNVYVIGRKYDEKEMNHTYKRTGYTYHILTYFKDESFEDDNRIELSNNYICKLKTVVNNSGEVFYVGFYSDNPGLIVDGTFFKKVELQTNTTLIENLNVFTNEFLTQTMSAKTKAIFNNGKYASMNDYGIDDLIVKDDGSFVMIGEEFYIHKDLSSLEGKIEYTYNYDDIFVFNFSSEGHINWATKIGKRQNTLNDDGLYSSYSKAIIGNDIYFVFNDDEKNLNHNGKGEVEPFFVSGKPMVTLVQIGENGKQKRESLYGGSKDKILIVPKVGQQISSNGIVLLNKKDNSIIYSFVKFK